MDRNACAIAVSLALFLGVVSGCGPTPPPPVQYMRSSSRTYRPEAANCPIRMLTILPRRPFEELGTFDFSGYSRGPIETLAMLRWAIRERACREGADAVVGVENGYGWYISATAIRWTGPERPASWPTGGR